MANFEGEEILKEYEKCLIKALTWRCMFKTVQKTVNLKIKVTILDFFFYLIQFLTKCVKKYLFCFILDAALKFVIKSNIPKHHSKMKYSIKYFMNDLFIRIEQPVPNLIIWSSCTSMISFMSQQNLVYFFGNRCTKIN